MDNIRGEKELRANRAPMAWGDYIELRLLVTNMAEQHPRTCAFGKTPQLEQWEPGQDVPAMLRMEPDEAQQLMDDLWTCGLRPSEGTGSAGALAATQKHLDDMKAVAFHVLKVPFSRDK